MINITVKEQRPRVIFIHSLNNYSGSPKVLAGVIGAFSPDQYRLELLTSSGEGFLSGLQGIKRHSNGYRWKNSKAVTLFYLLLSQCYGCLRVCLWSGRNTVFYINSIIPFGPILACWLTGKKMIVHIHEDMNTSKFLYRICRMVVKMCVRDSIFVSRYLCDVSDVKGLKHVVYNGINLPTDRLEKRISDMRKTVLMVSSLRREKGVYMFSKLAGQLAQYDFELVLSATDLEVSDFVKEVGELPNLRVFALQTDLSPFYNKASLLLQLTQSSKVVETYGMTIIEAMSYGVPSIVPNCGGPQEIVNISSCGLACNTENSEEIVKCMDALLSDPVVYNSLSERCLVQVKQFTLQQMQEKIATIVYDKLYS